MTAPGNDFLQILLALAFAITCGYATGRLHQWYRHGLQRDSAYREGYDHASHSMFEMALRVRTTPAEPAPRPHIAVVGDSRRRILTRAPDPADVGATTANGRRRRAA